MGGQKRHHTENTKPNWSEQITKIIISITPAFTYNELKQLKTGKAWWNVTWRDQALRVNNIATGFGFVQIVCKDTSHTEAFETITCCRHAEAWKGPIKPKQLKTNLATLPPLQTVWATDTESPLHHRWMVPHSSAGLRLGKSCTGQILNLTQHIEDGSEQGRITGIVLVALC